MQLDARALPKAWLRPYQIASIGVDTRKMTVADHSTSITEYDLSLHDLTNQYISIFRILRMQNAKN